MCPYLNLVTHILVFDEMVKKENDVSTIGDFVNLNEEYRNLEEYHYLEYQ